MVDRIVEFLRPYLSAPWGYVIVGSGMFLENSVGAGVIVPGETLVIIGGFYARIGRLSVVALAIVVVCAAVAGDNTGYWIGRRFGRGFLERHGHVLRVTPEKIARADRFYVRHGGKTIFLGRFIPVVRSVGFILAGASGMPWNRFFAYDLAGAFIWGCLNVGLGYALGEGYRRADDYLRMLGLAVLVILLLLLGVTKLLAARRERADSLKGGGKSPDQ